MTSFSNTRLLIKILASSTLLGCSDVGPNNRNEVEITQNTETSVLADENIQKIYDTALNGLHSYEITKSLTTEIGPRLAGSRNEARARKWATKKMNSLGFKKVRIDNFDIPGWERGVETASIMSPSRQQLFVTALGGSVATPAKGVRADVAYFENFDALTSSPESGLDGKIVYISGKMKKARDGAGYGPANQKRRSGATEAAKRGAAAVIIRSVGTDSHRFPHTGQMRYQDGVKKIPIGAISAPDADQLDRIFKDGKNVKLNLRLTPKSVGPKPSGNVIGEIVGSEKPDEIILIGAHLDSWDLGTGAIDDGAGVGIAMGAAQVLLESGLKPKRTIRVVLYGSEEVGLLGGKAYAEQHNDELANHIVATESDFGAGKIYGFQAGKTTGSKLFVSNYASMFKGLNIAAIEGESDGGPDIGPIAALGVPTVRLNQDGTDYFDLHHTPDDTFDKIDPDAMAQNVAAYATLIWLASETDIDLRGQ